MDRQNSRKEVLTLRIVMTWAFAATSLGLLVWQFVLYARAMAPRRGTLEWIARADRPAFSVFYTTKPLGRQDAGPMALTALLALCCWLALALVLLRTQLMLTGLQTWIELAFFYGVGPVLAVCGLYGLSRLLGAEGFAPTMAAAILAVSLSWNLYAVPCLVLATAFTLVFFARETGLWPLVLAAATLAVAAYCSPQALYFGAVLYLPIAACAFARFHTRTRLRGLWLAVELLAFPVLLALAVALTLLPGLLISGGGAVDYYQSALLARYQGTLYLPGSAALYLSAADAMLGGYALCCAAALLADFGRDRSVQTLLSVLLLLGVILLALCTGLNAIAAGSLPVCACFWSRWQRRGGTRPAAMAAGLLLALQLATLFLTWKQYI